MFCTLYNVSDMCLSFPGYLGKCQYIEGCSWED